MSDTMNNLFFDATKEVFSLMLDLDNISYDQETLHTMLNDNESIGIKIGIVGDYKGSISYIFSKEAMLEMVKIMSGMDVSEVDDFVKSAVSEVANIISGKAMTSLSENEIVCDILPPVIYIGETVNDGCRNKSSCSFIKTDIGNIELDMELQKNK